MKPLHFYLRSCMILILFISPLFNLHAKKWVVTVKNNSFFPFNLTHVKAGDTIQWVWVEGVHTTTSTSIPDWALEWDYPITQQEPSAIVIPMVNGTYQYVCTLTPGMNGTFTVSGALGISSPSYDQEIRLFPNPAADRINISTNINDIDLLRIFDTKGTKVSEIKFDNQFRSITRTIDLTNFPPGVYFFEFTLESNIKRVLRVVHTGK
jgi:plastocyanin